MDKGTAYYAFHYLPISPNQPSVTYAPTQTQAPANLVANLALFQFKTRDGSAPKPNSPVMTGSLQFSHEQLQQIVTWAQTQQPDTYGKIRLSVSVWQEVSAQGQPYLKGNAKTPLPAVAGPMVQVAASYQQQANQAMQSQVYGGARYPGQPAVVGQQPSPIPYNPWPNQPQADTGNQQAQTPQTVTGPMPAWNNQDAWRQQQQPSVPMQTDSVQQGHGSLPRDATAQPPAPSQQQTLPVMQPAGQTQQQKGGPTAAGKTDGNPPF
ncbi:MAG: hypothetical protein F4219_05765 [Gammaproteobacteria bacterium]|nr:hypothetical protein [Gammaproteobacteria bacterium]